MERTPPQSRSISPSRVTNNDAPEAEDPADTAPQGSWRDNLDDLDSDDVQGDEFIQQSLPAPYNTLLEDDGSMSQGTLFRRVNGPGVQVNGYVLALMANQAVHMQNRNACHDDVQNAHQQVLQAQAKLKSAMGNVSAEEWTRLLDAVKTAQLNLAGAQAELRKAQRLVNSHHNDLRVAMQPSAHVSAQRNRALHVAGYALCLGLLMYGVNQLQPIARPYSREYSLLLDDLRYANYWASEEYRGSSGRLQPLMPYHLEDIERARAAIQNADNEWAQFAQSQQNQQMLQAIGPAVVAMVIMAVLERLGVFQ